MQVLSNLDLAKNELQNARLQNLPAHPSSPVPGQFYFNSTDNRFYGWTGASWIDLGQVLTGSAIVALINASSSIIDDDNLSSTVADALTKRHAHANADILNAMEQAFTTALKNKLDGIAANANNYVHPTTAGNKHVPSGGSAGQVLKYGGSSGTAAWGSLTNGEVTDALGYTPVKNGGNTPEIGGGAESARPAATGSGAIYFAVDTGLIWRDTAAGTWSRMGGQDIPIATQSMLGLIKVGANLTILPDGTLNANDNPASFLIKQEAFTAATGQTTFNLTKGSYKPGAGAVFWYLFGQKQESSALTESSPTSVQIAGLEAGDEVLIEYIEIINASPYPVHASEHLTGGADPIPKATAAADGLMAKEDKSKLDGIAAGANNYSHPNHTGDVTSVGGGATTIASNAVTNAKLADVPTATIKGRVAAGTGDPADLTVAQVKTLLEFDKKADLDAEGKVPASQLPSYVDDVLEFATLANFPATGESGKIYVATNTNLTYRWSGTVYVEISSSLALGETSATAYRGDRGKIAYDHSQAAHAPSNAQKNSDITKAEIEAKLTGVIVTHSHTVTKGDVGLGSVDNVQQATKAEFTAHDGDGTRHITAPERTTWNAKAGKYAAAVGNGSATQFTITHSLGSMDVAVTLRENAAPYEVVYPDVQIIDVNSIRLLFGAAPAANQYRVTVVG